MDIAVQGLTELQSYLMQLAEQVPKAPSLTTGFTTSFVTILVCEIGDKTFFLAMIMASRYAQSIVFLGGYGALFVMTVLSTAFGKIATAWISPLFTNIMVTVLFMYFGIKLLIDAKNHVEEEENEELKEVGHEIDEMELKYIERNSQNQPLTPNSPSKEQDTLPGKKKKLKIPSTYILSQAFIMTFLAEWGDRSQIATIGLAASFNVYMVTIGALLGHLICTMAAVRLGEWISGKVSEKTMMTVGGIVFIISGICTAALALDNIYDSHHKPV